MNITQPISARIKKRYKRFLADVVFENGEEATVYVPNTGSMKTCWEENWPIILSRSSNPKRKYQLTLEMLYNGKSWIGVNTSLTNHLVEEALNSGIIEELKDFDDLKAEVKQGKSRLDFLITKDGKKHFIEVKNVTLLSAKNTVTFPDAISTRGQKHIRELIELVEQGHQSTLLFVIQREDAQLFDVHNPIDPEYEKLLRKAKDKGVQILAYQCSLNENQIKISHPLEVKF